MSTEVFDAKLYVFTEKYDLRFLKDYECDILRAYCKLAKDYYNEGIINKQNSKDRGEYLSYKYNYRLCNNDKEVKLLNTHIKTEILKDIDKVFTDYFQAQIKGIDVKKPTLLPEDAFYRLTITQFTKKANGKVEIPSTPNSKKLYGKVTITIPKEIRHNNIEKIIIIPNEKGDKFKAHFIHKCIKIIEN